MFLTRNFIMIFLMILYIFIAIFLFKLYMRIATDKISDFLILNKRNKKIQQYISIKSALKKSISLNYYNGKTQNIDKILDKSFEDFKDFIHNTKYKTLYTSTNPFMERRLRQLASSGFIVLRKINNKPKYKRQFLERLTLMGLKTSLYNLPNTKYWKYIFKKVKVNKFEIIIKNSI